MTSPWIRARIHVPAACLYILLGATAWSQSADTAGTPPAFLGVSLGASDFHVKDRYLSPFTYRGLLFASRLTCELPAVGALHSIEAAYATGSPASTLQTRELTEKIGEFSYTLRYNITGWTIGGRSLLLSAGGGLSSFVANTDFDTHDSFGVLYHDQSWYWAHSLNAAARLEYSAWEGGAFTLDLTAPLFSLVSRPGNGHWMSNDNIRVGQNFLRAALNGQAVYPWDTFPVFARLSLRERVGDHVALRGSYRFNYASADAPVPMGMYANTFLAGMDWVF